MRKKGFTLIELLAVIVILAIIALIATPIVLDIIDDTKESATLRSAEFYVEGLETSIAQSTLNNKKLENKTYNILPTGNLCLKYKEDNSTCNDKLEVKVSGETPTSGTITLQNGKIEDIKLKYENGKVIVYDNNKKLVYFSLYQESENIEMPDLYNNTLTPVIYDGNNWVIADVTKKWYNYSKQEWANAVILNSNGNKKVGDVVTVDGTNPDVLAMFVWIPRYEYKIEGIYGKGGTSKTSPGEIEVNFITKDTKQPSDTYRIHPAFNFAGEDISGIWIAKFELSHTTKTNSLGCTTETCSESDNLRIIPNVQSLRNNNVSSFFYAIRSMSKDKNVFGINSNITDSHMMKNSEWGAVAYLSQSRYGKYGNISYKPEEKEVYINNSSGFYTGRSGGLYGGKTPIDATYPDQVGVTTQYNNTGYYTYDGYLLKYNTNTKTETRDLDKVASTTGNIYGIYDMSGGAWEYVMGSFANSDGEKWAHNSGFAGKSTASATDVEGLEWPNEKYYEIYKASSGTTIDENKACNGGVCNGHALSETSGWYGDYADFVSSSYPWFKRGGDCANGANAGVFNSLSNFGDANNNNSARVVLSSTT